MCCWMLDWDKYINYIFPYLSSAPLLIFADPWQLQLFQEQGIGVTFGTVLHWCWTWGPGSAPPPLLQFILNVWNQHQASQVISQSSSIQLFFKNKLIIAHICSRWFLLNSVFTWHLYTALWRFCNWDCTKAIVTGAEVTGADVQTYLVCRDRVCLQRTDAASVWGNGLNVWRGDGRLKPRRPTAVIVDNPVVLTETQMDTWNHTRTDYPVTRGWADGGMNPFAPQPLRLLMSCRHHCSQGCFRPCWWARQRPTLIHS